MAGLYFEQFAPGQHFQHSSLTMNAQPLHIDAHFAAQTEFGKPLINSLFTLGLMIGMTVNDTTLGTTVANLGMSEVVFPKPIFAGDTHLHRARWLAGGT